MERPQRSGQRQDRPPAGQQVADRGYLAWSGTRGAGGNGVGETGEGQKAAAAADGLDTRAEGDKPAGAVAVAAGFAAGDGDWLVPLHAANSAGTASTRCTTIRGITEVNRSVRTGS